MPTATQEWETTVSDVMEGMTVFHWTLFDDGRLGYKPVEIMDGNGSAEPVQAKLRFVGHVRGQDVTKAAQRVIVGRYHHVLQRVL